MHTPTHPHTPTRMLVHVCGLIVDAREGETELIVPSNTPSVNCLPVSFVALYVCISSLSVIGVNEVERVSTMEAIARLEPSEERIMQCSNPSFGLSDKLLCRHHQCSSSLRPYRHRESHSLARRCSPDYRWPICRSLLLPCHPDRREVERGNDYISIDPCRRGSQLVRECVHLSVPVTHKRWAELAGDPRSSECALMEQRENHSTITAHAHTEVHLSIVLQLLRVFSLPFHLHLLPILEGKEEVAVEQMRIVPHNDRYSSFRNDTKRIFHQAEGRQHGSP